MHFVFLLLYNAGIRMYFLLVHLLWPFNTRARNFVQGRRGQWKKIREVLGANPGNGKTVWFHFASLGEFEQGRPLMEWVKKRYPQSRLVVTFFSPSGYNLRKNYALADGVFYLPADTSSNAKKLLKQLNPALVVFVKYEFWLHHILEVQKRRIPLLLVSAVFRKDQPFFNRLSGPFFRQMLPAFTQVFVQDKQSMQLAHELGMEQASLSGDTRFDRVLQTVAEAQTLEKIEQFKANARLLIAGSSWPEEEKLVAAWLPNKPAGWKVVIAPHDVSPSHIREVLNLFPGAVCYSDLENGAVLGKDKDVLVIDSVGLLSRIYRYGDAALIGGGFGRGLHNILEAAAFGMPVMFGPHTGKFWEAGALERAGGGFSVARPEDFVQRMEVFCNQDYLRKHAAEAARGFVRHNSGALQQITSVIEKSGWL